MAVNQLSRAVVSATALTNALLAVGNKCRSGGYEAAGYRNTQWTPTTTIAAFTSHCGVTR